MVTNGLRNLYVWESHEIDRTISGTSVCVCAPTECVRRTAMILDKAMFHSSSVNALVTSPCVAWRMWSSTTKNLTEKKPQN